MSEHAILAPSSAHVRKLCPGSRALSALVPETEESPEAREGTAAHWAFAELLAGRQIDSGQIAPNGVMLTDEMIEGADMYYDDVMQFADLPQFAGFTPLVEQRVGISTIHPENWGTPDTSLFAPYELIVWDYKFGHRYVEVFENWQLIEYAAGLLEKHGINGVSDHKTKVRFRIIQPRCYYGGATIREWVVMASDLRGYFNEARRFEALSMEPNAPVMVNEHCRDCAGRHICKSLQRAAYAAMGVADEAVPFNLNNEALGTELRFINQAIDILEARKTGLEEQATALLKGGQLVPHFKLEQGYGRETWNKPHAEIVALGAAMGVDLVKPALITPKQAIAAGLDSSIVQYYAHTPNGKISLKPDDGIAARKVFGVLTK